MVDVDALKEFLTKEAANSTWGDDPDFMVDDCAAGNINDAYYGGTDDGGTLMARRILEKFFKDEGLS